MDITEPQMRALAKVGLAMFVASRQGVDELDQLETAIVDGFASYHSLDRDLVAHFYLQAMETLSNAPFVYCGIHGRQDFIDAILQNPSSPAQVLEFVAQGLDGVAHQMNYRQPEPPPEPEIDLIIQ